MENEEEWDVVKEVYEEAEEGQIDCVVQRVNFL